MAINTKEAIYQTIINEFSKTIEFFDISPSEARLFSMLYLEGSPMTLDEMSETLGKSKTSVSTGIRTLLDSNLVRRVWKKGVRKDLYATNNDLYRKFMQAYINKWMEHTINQNNTLIDIEKNIRHTNISVEEKELLNKLSTIIAFHTSIEEAFSKINPKQN
ncbi:HTH-type transcriptional repressor OpcR [Paraliobacillus sp. PM-2]|uniref:GbsR/MarR family transcriptional regulator n=1 Tax=Paraliobacillus sp. PM-2 TaxID=1462524 RepID=UPI00061B9946|nr:hypothetical protein [Paraliobacillus sp. PM-2]CQR47045.1 HTH-type transcriptional repressor OpcR [Paraliobacillus sp. PM-2]